MNIMIAGYGQIGQSVHGLYKDLIYNNNIYNSIYSIYINDLYSTVEEEYLINSGVTVDVLHICIPYDKDFKKSVEEYTRLYTPDVTIIHSTVDISTTRDLCDSTGADIVHSPVMGKHPNLKESLQIFTKIIGGNTIDAIDKAYDHLTAIGVNCVVYKNSDESEAAKLLDTTYYGWNILYMKHVNKLCKDRNLDFENVYTTTNEIYNKGYEAMGNPEFKRPVLKYYPGKIGGHCVRPNFEILKDSFYPAKISIDMDEDESI